MRTLRFHGSRDKVTYEEVGYNSRLDELQAAALRVLLPHVHAWCDAPARRRARVRGRGPGRARRACPVAGRRAPTRRGTSTSCATRGAEELAAALRGAGDRRAHVLLRPRAPPAGDRRVGRDAVLPGTDEAARTHLALPMGAALTREQVGEVVGAVRSAEL